MKSKRIEEATRLVEEAIIDCFNREVSIMDALMKCNAIAKLLEIDDEHKWIRYEIEGYPSSQSTKGVTLSSGSLPSYRHILLTANLAGSSKHGEFSLWHRSRPQMPQDYEFWVTEPIGFLETVEKYEVKRTITTELGSSYTYLLFSTMTKGRINSILMSVRARMHEFLMEQKDILVFSPLVEHIFESTKNIVISKLTELDPDLVDELFKMLDRQQTGGTDLDWRGAADACRNILQRFTEILITPEILGEENPKPDEDDTIGKMSLIINYVRSKTRGKKGKKSVEFVSAGLDYFFNYFKSLKHIVESVKHKPISQIEKDEVDRAVAYVFLWMGDVIRLLEKAGYDWDKAKKTD